MALQVRKAIKEDFEKLLKLVWFQKEPREKSGEFLEISQPLSKVARFYEWLRNVIDIKEEHLLRRNAIFRIIRREIVIEGKKNNLAYHLLKELIAGGYLASNAVLESEVKEYEAIIQKYQKLVRNFSFVEDKEKIDWWLSVASVEIDKKLSPDFYQKEKIISSIAFKGLKNLISNLPDNFSEKDFEVLLKLSILKIIFKYDLPVLRERLINSHLPNWNEVNDLENIGLEKLEELRIFIEKKIRDPYLVKVSRFVKRYALFFWLLDDSLNEALILSDNFEEFRSKVLNEDSFKAIVERSYFKRLKKSEEKLGRLTIRSIFFLLLTKTILALIFELPYDLYIEKRTDYTPLFVNIIFHPLFLGFLAYSFKLKKPQPDLATKGVEEMFFEVEKSEIVKPVKIMPPRSRKAENLLKFAWLVSFFVVFGLIVRILCYLNFNIVSIFFFIFFLTLVSYLGWRARNIVSEAMILKEKSTFLSLLVDFFSLPVIKMGERLSAGLPNLNVFIFLMDFIIESPFKAILKGLEEWFAFLKEKKEEIEI